MRRTVVKVILTEEVEKLGGSNEVVDVADGYARNFLLPRSLAVPATKSALSNLSNTIRVDERRQTRLRGAAETQAKTLENQTLVMPVKLGNAGRIYGSIGTADIVKQLKAALGVELERKQVLLDEPIRSVGRYPVALSLHRDVKTNINVQVGDAQAPVVAAPAQDEAAPVESTV